MMGEFLGSVDSGSFGFSELEDSGERKVAAGEDERRRCKANQVIIAGEVADGASALDEDRSEEALRLFW
jgi:hypothetical protein